MTLVKFFRRRTDGSVETLLVRTLRKKAALELRKRAPTVPEAEVEMRRRGWTRRRLKPTPSITSGLLIKGAL